jgi:hypothetical protein
MSGINESARHVLAGIIEGAGERSRCQACPCCIRRMPAELPYYLSPAALQRSSVVASYSPASTMSARRPGSAVDRVEVAFVVLS